MGTIAMTLNKSGSTVTNSTIKGVSTLVYGGTLTVTNIGSGVLTVGDSFKLFYATNYLGVFTSIIPAAPGPGLVWVTNNLALNGTLAVALGAVHPQVNQFSFDGTNTMLNGSGGAAGYICTILSSTNLTAPLTNWTVVGSSVCDSSGNFGFTNSLALGSAQQFFTVRVP